VCTFICLSVVEIFIFWHAFKYFVCLVPVLFFAAYTNCKGIKNNTSLVQTTGIQEEQDTTCK
jgi:hypothetical protein